MAKIGRKPQKKISKAAYSEKWEDFTQITKLNITF